MSDEIKIEEIQAQNQEILSGILNASDGPLSKTAAAGTKMLRRKIRENGFFRNILDFRPVTDDMLTPFVNTDLPVIIEEMEPDAPAAKSVPFDETGDSRRFHGDKFVVYFHKITTDEFTKNVEELRTYKGDLREFITSAALKSVHTQEDTYGIAQVDEIVGAVGGVGEAGVQQNFNVTAELGSGRAALVDLLPYLQDRDLNNGVWLMNQTTGQQYLKWPREQMGGDMAETLILNGLTALTEAKICGVPHLFTIKKNLVPTNVIYQFAEQEFLGRAYTLTELKLYVKKEKDVLTFSAEEKIGVTIANVAAVNKVTMGVSAS